MNYLCLYALGGAWPQIRNLLDKGADINSIDEEGNTALIVAIDSVKTDVVKNLLVRNADFSIRNLKEETALTTAMQYINVTSEKKSRMEIILLLKRHGAFIDIKYAKDVTALSIFRENVSMAEFEACFPEFCQKQSTTPQPNNNSWLAQQWPSLHNWMSSFWTTPTTAIEMQPTKKDTAKKQN